MKLHMVRLAIRGPNLFTYEEISDDFMNFDPFFALLIRNFPIFQTNFLNGGAEISSCQRKGEEISIYN